MLGASELNSAEVAFAESTARLDEAQAALAGHVAALREAREQHAPRLELAVREQLAALAMADATFAVSLTPREPGPTGGDAVEFLIAPNPGVPAGPLREIGSGGELSRVMLALATVPGRTAPARGGARAAAKDSTAASSSATQATLVFDEVDAGIGGHTARAVGERLRDLGRARQVLCITHLPQIASLGDRHFSVVKDTTADLASAAVVQLAEGEVVSELVRMLGADESDSDRAATCARSAQSRLSRSAAIPERVRKTAAAVTLDAMAANPRSPRRSASQSSSEAPMPATTAGALPGGDVAPWRTVTGPVRPGRRTKLLVKHLSRGDIALIDHLDIDRVSAEELIAANAGAVLNCRASSSGTYPNLGPQLLVEAGIHLVDLPDDSLFELLSDGEAITVPRRRGGARRGGAGAR